jgi:hypothetical protein
VKDAALTKTEKNICSAILTGHRCKTDKLSKVVILNKVADKGEMKSIDDHMEVVKTEIDVMELEILSYKVDENENVLVRYRFDDSTYNGKFTDSYAGNNIWILQLRSSNLESVKVGDKIITP